MAIKSGVNEATEVLSVCETINRNPTGCLRTITPHIRTRHIVQSNSSAFEALKDNFKQLPLLWIHIRSFPVVDAKELVVKVSNVFLQEAPTQCYCGGRLILAPVKAVNVKP